MTNVERAFIHQLAQTKWSGFWSTSKYFELDQNIWDMGQIQNSEVKRCF